MSTGRRVDEATELYARFRLSEQRHYYQQRCEESATARNQARTLGTALLVLASTAGALAGADVAGGRRWWAVTATVLSAVVAALTAYEATYGFDRLAREYEEAAESLARLDAQLLDAARSGPRRGDALRDLVGGVEALLTGEVQDWIRSASAARDEQTIDLHEQPVRTIIERPPAPAP